MLSFTFYCTIERNSLTMKRTNERTNNLTQLHSNHVTATKCR